MDDSLTGYASAESEFIPSSLVSQLIPATTILKVHVPLESTDPTLTDRRVQYGEDDGSDLLPLPHLTATTILGGADPERDTLGQLFATQIASSIAGRMPEEKRLLVVGMGFRSKETDGETFVQILDLVMEAMQ